jgi:hypothetical protein
MATVRSDAEANLGGDKLTDRLIQPDTSKKRPSDRGLCYFYPPTLNLSLDWALSHRGSENLHLYLWLLKDLSWAEGNKFLDAIFANYSTFFACFIDDFDDLFSTILA